jgi:primosomal protein N' (replication factor Y)
MRYAQVIVDINHSNVDKVFAYAIPQGMELQAGDHVLVPFGGGNRKTEGFVVGLSERVDFDPARVKPILQVLDAYSILRPDQIELARWMKEHYRCLLVDALRLMIPAQIRGGRVHEKQVRMLSLAEGLDFEGAIAALTSKQGVCKAPVQMAVLEKLQGKEWNSGELSRCLPGCEGAVKALLRKSWIEEREETVLRRPYGALQNRQEEGHRLTEDQQRVVEKVCAAMEAGSGRFLLRGVTGSGKTEVYMRCISRCMEQGRSAIMLVPEISLTPQTVERFRSRFGENVAVLHSRLSPGERYDEWRRIRLGQVRVVVGARSAVFAPFESIGLIVIDEEHESSYKSDQAPRYEAAEIALQRCAQQGATLLQGSATPSLEHYHQAKEGFYELLTLEKRINGQPLPQVELADMRLELEKGNRGMFSQKLLGAMRQCIGKGQQMILFLNRRGYSTFVSCRGCGYVVKCENCDISMTYHKVDGTVRCHYCGQQHPVPTVCPECGKPYLKHFGAGTQQVEEQVHLMFPGAKTLRMDYDTTQTKDAHLAILGAFARGEAQVLIGTQMIAKGLDFPNVTLVGVVAADSALFVPDYRSAERAFQLLTQVAGRAGRDAYAGRVIVQTYSPEHPSIKFAQSHDYESFYDYEIRCRQENEFPPFADFVRILLCGGEDAELEQQRILLRKELESLLHNCMAEQGYDPETLIYISDHPAPLHFLRGEYRHQVLLKLRRSEQGNRLLELVLSFGDAKRRAGEHFSLEINPQNML